MGNYHARVEWTRGSDEFLGGRYSRGHRWLFDEGLDIPASASPAHVGKWAVAAAVDPEEAVVAATSSCHMLFFLSFAAKDGYRVERYEDPATGTVAPDDRGREALTLITLRPRVTFSGTPPAPGTFDTLHHRAHEACYIANSLRTEVRCEPELVLA